MLRLQDIDASSAILPAYYDYERVAWSIVIAVAGAYAAFDLAGRVNASQGWVRQYWLLGGAIATGIGTWSIHYVGMFAFRLPVPVEHHCPRAIASLVAAVFSYAGGCSW